ncbi:hypothetical protein QJQ45_010901 [Haematococcus lacustris]|nr:hypothetical protein QJQ45_010901 [Haematococcus lacustris]
MAAGKDAASTASGEEAGISARSCAVHSVASTFAVSDTSARAQFFAVLLPGAAEDVERGHLAMALAPRPSGGFIPVVMSYAMFFGGAGQLIAGILELIKGNTFAGTAFSSYGCFWMGWFLFNYFAVSKITPSVTAVAMTGDTLWCGLWGVLTFLFYIVTLRKNGCLQTIFLSLWITFFLLAGGNYSDKCKEAAGYVGFFCGSSAIYAAIAMLYQDELGWTLPGMRPTNFI